MANNILRIDKAAAIHVMAGKSTKDELETGSIVTLGKLLDDGEGYEIGKPTDIEKNDLYIFAPSILMYDETKGEEDFINPVGQMGRIYQVERGDIFTYCDSFITGATKVGEYVVPVKNSYKLAPASALTNEKLAFKVIAKELLAGFEASVLQVVKA